MADATDTPDEPEPTGGEHDHSSSACADALEELSLYLDGELTDQKRSQIRHHLDDCNPCFEAFDFEAELRIVISTRCRDEVPETLRTRIVQQLSSPDQTFDA
jgi:mycothiol system anti-sigma-R factor